MANWFLETGLYLLGVALIPLVGIVLVCWGLWGDRSKGRPRCPKCWYDMRGSLPRLECPECGHDAKQERRLYRNRRRWRPVVLGAMSVLLLSYPLTIVGTWHSEQSAIQKLTKRRHMPGAPIRIGPAWLVGLLPERAAQFFDRIDTVQILPGGTDADLAQCKELHRLSSIHIHEGADVTDAGLVHLTGLGRLRSLYLSGDQVTNASLVCLKGLLPQLQYLCLSETQVTDAGLAQLEDLPQLQTLILNGSQVTDAGLVQVQAMSQLEGLGLAHTKVTAVGLAHLTRLSQLQFLALSGTHATDAGLAHLGGLSQLRSLLLILQRYNRGQ